MGWAVLVFFGYALIVLVRTMWRLWPLDSAQIESRLARRRIGMNRNYVVGLPIIAGLCLVLLTLAALIDTHDAVGWDSGYRIAVGAVGSVGVLAVALAFTASTLRRPNFLLLPAYRKGAAQSRQ